VTTADVVMLATALAIVLLWGVGWYRQRSQSWATRRYLSALVSVLVIFACVFGLVHYAWRIG
jgi:hypothetical protein